MTLLSLLRSATSSKAGNTVSSAEVEEFFDQQAKSQVHLSSPGITDDASANEVLRRQFKPVLPSVFTASPGEPNLVLTPCDEAALINKQDRENNAPPEVSEETKKILSSLFPHTSGSPFQLLQPAPAGTAPLKKPLRIGAVLSGGQAAGGHNVLCGIFDYVKRVNPDSRLYGFLGGPHGVYSHEYKELTADIIDHYRNSGGFDMIRSGRHKVETEEQKQKSLEICSTLQLDGLVVIGGDDSNTNAAVLAEYFKSKGSTVSVVGCPKTIDGDLKNYFVEISFGFDTACKTYSQIIGNLMEDARTGGHVYHFVRLMGRSASLITLECALQSHPNLALIGEEVQARKHSLQQLVATLADLVEARHAKGKNYGIVLLPEGLIEFIPEVGVLIREINQAVAHGAFSVDKLSAESRRVFEGLPESTQQQLLLDRDPHGNVQVAMIHTEKLLAEMTETELRKRRFHGEFHASCHYLGYEGRSGYPSLFDATYCYALGHVAAGLVQHGATACMAVLKNMSSSSSPTEWKPAGIPLTRMMTLETRKGKANAPVIKKFLVDIDRPLFKIFAEVREEWKTNDFYQIPGPLQLPQLGSSGGTSHHFLHHHSSSKDTPAHHLLLPYTLVGAPAAAALLSTDGAGADSLSSLRRAEEPLVPAALRHKDTVLCLSPSTTPTAAAAGGGGACVGEKELAAAAEKLKEVFPLLIEECCSGSSKVGFMKGSSTMVLQPKTEPQHHLTLRVGGGGGEKIRVGVVLIGRQMPAVSNVLLGVVERVSMLNGKVLGFKGARGLLKNEHVIVSDKDAQMHRNLPAFDLLGRTENDEALLCTAEGMRAALETIRRTSLDFLVVIGWTFLHAATLSELLAQEKLHARVVSIATEADFSHFLPGGCLHILRHLTGKHVVIGAQQPVVYCPMLTRELLELGGCRRLGFDTQTKVAAEMIGNLETDSNSAAKYYYFCAAAGGWDAECEAAIQTHPNVVIASQKWKDMPLQELVNFVVEVVKERAALKKNFGVVILNLNLFLLHRELRCLAMEVDAHLEKYHREKQQQQQGKETKKEAVAEQLLQYLSPAAQKTFGVLPSAFQKKLISCLSKHPFPRGLHKYPVHELLSHMVGEALKKEKAEGRYSGTFSPVCFEFSSALSSSFPSYYDCSLGLMLGQLAVLAGTARALPSHAVHVSIKNPAAAPTHWEPQVLPTAVLAAQAHCLQVTSKPAPETAAAKEEQGAGATAASDLFCLPDGCCAGGGAASSSSIVQLVEQGMQQQQQKGGAWTTEEKYCNPGPLQFGGQAKDFCFSRALCEATRAH